MERTVELGKWYWLKNQKNKKKICIKIAKEIHSTFSSNYFIAKSYKVGKKKYPELIDRYHQINETDVGKELNNKEIKLYNIPALEALGD